MLGAYTSEMEKGNSEDLRSLGNWDPKIQETRHSFMLPMQIFLYGARFWKAKGLHLILVFL